MEKIKIKSVDDGLTGKKQVPINLMLKNKLGAKWILIIVISFIFGGLGGILAERYLLPYLVTLPPFEKYKFLQPRETKIVVKKEEIKNEISEFENFSRFVNKVQPAIVSVVPREELDDFFGRVKKINKGGEGVVVTSDGMILTTKQVVSRSGNFLVIFSDGKNYEVNKFFFDPASDLVFLKVNVDNLPIVEMTDFDRLVLGEKIFALQNLLLNDSKEVVKGTIISLNKKESFKPQEEKLDSVLLLQLELDKLSLGSPIFDVEGKMVGIVRKVGKMSEAVSAKDINFTLSNLIKNKKIERVKMGIKYLPVTPDFAYFKNFSKSYGIFLPQYAVKDSVEKDSPAERAGLKPGDLIYALDGQEIRDNDTYFRLLQRKSKGEEIEVSYLRKNKEYKTKVILQGQ